MDILLIVLMSLSATGFAIVATIRANTPKNKIYQFKSGDLCYIIHSEDDRLAIEEAKKITVLHSIEWDHIEEISKNGKPVRTIVKKVQKNSIKTKSLA